MTELFIQVLNDAYLILKGQGKVIKNSSLQTTLSVIFPGLGTTNLKFVVSMPSFKLIDPREGL